MAGFNFKAEAADAAAEDVGAPVPVTDRMGNQVFADDSEERPATITVAGEYSRYYRAAEDKIHKRTLNADKMTMEQVVSDNMERALSCTLDWDGIMEDADKPLDFNRHNVKQVYLQCPWIYDSVWKAIHDHARFTKRA